MTTDIIISPAAERDLGRLDRRVAQRVANAIERYAATGAGDVKRLEASGDELRLRVGDWRVRFTSRIVTRSADPPGTGTVQVRVIEIVRVLPRGRAYRD